MTKLVSGSDISGAESLNNLLEFVYFYSFVPFVSLGINIFTPVMLE